MKEDAERLKRQLRRHPQIVPRVLSFLKDHYDRGAYQTVRKNRWRYTYVPFRTFHHLVLLALIGLAVLEDEDETRDCVEGGPQADRLRQGDGAAGRQEPETRTPQGGVAVAGGRGEGVPVERGA